MKKYTLLSILLIWFTAFTAAGCGESDAEKELSSYQASMTTFCNNVSYLDGQINALDGTGESDVEKLLGHLDTLNDQFAQMAELPVPEEFATVDSLADEASENMNMAVYCYREAYASTPFNKNYADAAFEYYARANIRLGYILQILHGEEILDENVKYITEDPPAEN